MLIRNRAGIIGTISNRSIENSSQDAHALFKRRKESVEILRKILVVIQKNNKEMKSCAQLISFFSFSYLYII